jgi:hypothetical protein
VVVLTLNPAGLLQESRDSNRLSDMATLNSAIGISLADNPAASLGSSSVLYVSIPDPSATSTLGDQCQGLGMPSLPSGWSWHCAASSTFRKADGTGWVPVNLAQSTFGSPLSQLPTDPVNATSSRLWYAYATDGQHYEITTPFESQKYRLGGSGDQIANDGGTLASVYEKGSKLGLMPLDYGDPSLVGLWTFDEGAGSVAYDWSGSNATGSWSGTPGYVAGKVGSYAGSFNGVSSINGGTSSVYAFSKTTPFSINLWFSVNSTGGEQYLISRGAIGGGNGDYLIDVLSSINRLLIDLVNTTGVQYVDFVPFSSYGTWHQVTGVYNGNGDQSGISLYLDGTLAATGASAPIVGDITTSLPLMISGPPRVNGLIDDVRIYNRVLSSAEIQALYSGGK